mgnify:CR=1 FL=1
MFKRATVVFLLFFLNFIASQEYDLPENIGENFVFFKTAAKYVYVSESILNWEKYWNKDDRINYIH